jgi:hypothetical protein
MTYLKTPAAARTLNTTYHRLIGLLRFGHLVPPQKDSSGDYCWTDSDLERARQALTRRGTRAEVSHAE